MLSRLRVSLAVAAVLLSIAFASGLRAAEADNTVRAELGKPLQAAQELIRQHNYRDALAKIREADAVTGKSLYETGVIEQMRGVAAAGAGDYPTAIRSFEAIIAQGRQSPSDQLKMIQALAGFAYQTKDYAKTISWAIRYLHDGGSDDQIRRLLAQAYFLTDDFSDAAKELQTQIKVAEHSGQKIPEESLQLLANCALKQNDNETYAATLRMLVASYPSKAYWAELIRRVRGRPGVADRLSLDFGRLEFAAGAVDTAAHYVDLTELSLQAGLPGEAKMVIDRGFTVGALGGGSGSDVDRHNRLRVMATNAAAADSKALPINEKEAVAAKDGNALVGNGLDYVGYGQAEKGIALIEQGIQRGGLKHSDDAKLHLGIAYFAAGQREKAVQVWKTIEGSDGTAELSRLWVLLASRPST